MKLQFRQCTIEDLNILCVFSRNMYYETFKGMCAPEDMSAYLEEAFRTEKIRGELENPHSSFYLLFDADQLVGYIKLNDAVAQSDLQDPDSLELERIYVSGTVQGTGFGSYLMKQAVDIAQRQAKKYLWLGVWEKNTKAIAFYHKHGFYEIGTHTFVMGDDAQTDYIMRKDL